MSLKDPCPVEGESVVWPNHWETKAAFDAYQEAFGAEYERLDAELERLTLEEELLGAGNGVG